MTTFAELQDIQSDLAVTDPDHNFKDRGEMYLRVHTLTNSESSVVEGNISTFSGFVGGTAYLANYILADKSQAGGAGYSYTMTDIYSMSQGVATGYIGSVIADYNDAGGGQGNLDVSQGIEAARTVWSNAGFLNQFPGNIFVFVDAGDIENIPVPIPSESDGAKAGFFGSLGGMLFGKSVEDFQGRSGYAIVNGPDIANTTDFYSVQRYVLHYDLLNGGGALPSGDRNLDGLINYEDGTVVMIDTDALDATNVSWELSVEANLALFAAPIALLMSVGDFNIDLDWHVFREWNLMKDFRVQLVEGGEYSFETYAKVNGVGEQKDFWYYAENLLGDTAGIVRNMTYAYNRTEAASSSSGDYLYGGLGSDHLTGLNGADLIRSGWGNDNLTGAGGNDRLYGEAGNDKIHGDAGGDYIEGGRGADTIYGGADNDTIDPGLANNGMSDYVDVGSGANNIIIIRSGYDVIIGISDPDAGIAIQFRDIDPSDVRYRQEGGSLIIEVRNADDEWVRTAKAEGHFNDGNIDKVEFYDGDTHLSAHDRNIDKDHLTSSDLSHTPSSGSYSDWQQGAASATTTVGGIWDPLVIDLDANGVYLQTGLHWAYFDITSDGQAESMGWISSGDAFLVRDLNSNGRIDNGSEMFGAVSGNGFSDLATLDDNADGIIDSNDAVWSTLLLWQDMNVDAQTLGSELHTLSSFNINGINLNSVVTNTTVFGSHRLTHDGVVTTTTGGTLQISNAVFRFDRNSTKYAGEYDVNPETLALPDLRGYNTIYSFRDALNLNTTADVKNGTTLLEKMQGIASNDLASFFLNYGEISATFEEAVFQWAGVVDIAADSRGDFMYDARALEFMERFYGEGFIDQNDNNATGPGLLQSQRLEDLWYGSTDFQGLFERLKTVAFMSLAPGQLLTSAVGFDINNDMITATETSPDHYINEDTIAQLVQVAQGLETSAEREAFWVNVVDFLQGLKLGDISSGSSYIVATSGDRAMLDAAIQESDSSLSLEGIEYRHANPYGYLIEGDQNPLALNDTLDGTYRADTMMGGEGNDTIRGGDGDDVIRGGAGNDILEGDGDNNTVYGDDGNDALYAGGGDHLLGGAGNDYYETGNFNISGLQHLLEDSEGNDVYAIEGPSTTYIEDSGNGADYVSISGNFNRLELIDYRRVGEGTLQITVSGGYSNVFSARIFLINQFVDEDPGEGVDLRASGNIESIYFAATNTWLNLSDLNIDITTYGADSAETIYGLGIGNQNDIIFAKGGDDVIHGLAGNDTLNGENGNDTIYGGEGNDNLYGGYGDDVIYGGDDNDVITDGYGSDIIYGGAGDDTIHSSEQYHATSVNWIYGGDGNDTIYAGGGVFELDASGDYSALPTYIDGGSGDDTIITSNANSIYIWSEGHDTIYESASTSNGYTAWGIDYFNMLEGQTINDVSAPVKITSSDTRIEFKGNLAGNSVTMMDHPAEFLQFTDGFKFRISTASSAGQWVEDTAGNDTITATGYVTVASLGNDTISGRNGGTDVIWGGDGDDIIYGLGLNDTLHGGAGNDQVYGGTENDQIWGGDGNDVIDGGSGDDAIRGGFGDDVLKETNSGVDVIDGEGGNDTVDYSAATNAMTIDLLAGTQTDSAGKTDTLKSIENAIGGSGNDTLIGTASGSTLAGGAGDDSLTGAAGNDTYIYSGGIDIITDAGGIDVLKITGGVTASDITFVNVGTYDTKIVINSGTDEIILVGQRDSSGHHIDTIIFDDGLTLNLSNYAGWVIGTDVADTLTGDSSDNTLIGKDGIDIIDGNDGNDFIHGGGGNDLITGGAGNDQLLGGTGNDSLAGGDGDDLYVIDTASDTVTENVSEGTDTVQSNVTYTLTDNVENLVLIENAIIDGTGNSLNNTITGNIAANTLSGALGADSLIGRGGDDTYIVDNVGDTVIEETLQGLDTVESSVTYTLADNVENITLTGSNAIDATGNALDNTLTGNSSINTLSGDAGNDTYIVDSTDDVLVEDYDEGSDTIKASVSYTILTNFENLTLTGSSNIDGTGNATDNIITGNSVDNTLTGNDGNDTLDGSTGVDTLIGGTGDDTYVIDNTGDIVTENADEGIDLVKSSLTYTLGSNVENLTLIGGSSINGTGNELANQITGNSAANTLTGGDGNDTLDGDTGVDSLFGGTGDDIYVVDVAGDTITEDSAEGTDLVRSSVSYTLASNVENLTLIGGGSISATGNSLDNILIGNSSNNTLTGGAGNDTLDGGLGYDHMVGGQGDDIYVRDHASDYLYEAVSEGTDIVRTNLSYTLLSNFENLTLTGNSAIDGTGNAADNIITGNEANNVISGGAGVDTLIGGAGNDTYVVDNIGDVITENENEGIDTIQSSITYALAGNVENISLTGSAAIDATGNNLDNNISGNSGNNTLTGGDGNDALNGNAGADTMIGGLGNDQYYVENISDVIVENTDEGTDTVISSASYTLSAHVENLTLTANGALTATGNSMDNILIGYSGANTLIGNDGNDTLNGGLGNDSLIGGLGDDTYVVDSSSDSITEYSGEGNDSVLSSISYTLSAYIENLTLTGTAANSATGNTLDNTITGNIAANALSGGMGADTLIGGGGADTYIVDNIGDVIVENIGEGVDVVNSSVTYSLADNVDNINLTGSSAIDATGNGLNNALIGNSAANTLSGGAGNDTLDGLLGADTLIGGAGDDVYIVDNNADIITENSDEGVDFVRSSVSYILSANIENISLTGSASVNLTGNGLNNVITGNSGANVLSGGTGADTLIGGTGNDTYVIDNEGDVITEVVNAGTDLVQSSISYVLSENLENLTLTGSSDIDGTGSDTSNIIVGNSGVNILSGGSGNDTLDGGAGADTLIGGAGDDTYVIDNVDDAITEVSEEGADLVQSSITYTLGSNLENLSLTGSAAINATGNSLENTLTGNSGANTLNGGDGNDTLNGGGGNDIIDGGSGGDIMAGGGGDDTFIRDDINDVLTEGSGQGTDTVQTNLDYTLLNNLENLTLTGASAINGTGNNLNNIITGNIAANVLSGGAGSDTLIGGDGNDTYIVDNAADVITENTSEGADLVQSSVAYTLSSNVENITLTGGSNISATGNSLDNVITGNAGNNSLTGGAGADTLIGGAGNDIYYVDNAGDVINESFDEGTDAVWSSVSYTLADNIENINLSGSSTISATGNSLDNLITGNSNMNTLSGGDGNDVLNGGGGSDTLIGGDGNDTYSVSHVEATVTEYLGEGVDTVQSSVTYTLSSNVEHLTLIGSNTINGTGNELDNIITGNNQANTLSGGAGVDTLIGGGGNDTYIVDNTSDIVTENASAGTDSIQSSVTYILSENVENITLTGSSNIDATANSLNNTITGNSGLNTLTGGGGNDTYVVNNTGDIIVENTDEGTDLVQSSATQTLSANVENITLTGSSHIDATGNSLDNILTGNSGNNVLSGGAGADTMSGGVGNDTYVVDNAGDVVTEVSSGGTDNVLSSITYSLGNFVENLTLTGSSVIDATGNTLDNILIGNTAANTLNGGSGNDTLDGGSDVDSLMGGQGNDTYIVDNIGDVVTENSGEGTDTIQASVSYTLSSYVENLSLSGVSAINGTGNTLDNTLTGNSGANALDGGSGNDTLNGGDGNDTLDGGSGTDNMSGGLGDDIYVRDNVSDILNESSGQGTDTVQTDLGYTLLSNFENLTLTGTSAINGTGNTLNNTIIGNIAANTLSGGSGADTLIGGDGNDTYIVDNTSDAITENSSEGTDLVQSSVTYTLSANIENITLTGSSNVNATGNSLDNVITGNTGNNTLSGAGGNDTLIGGNGADAMSGGTGDDLYIVDNTSDTITENSSEGTDSVQSSVTYTLSANIENITLTGSSAINGTGNALNNIIIGNSGINTLSGGAGADTMTGGLGNDIYVVDNVDDIVNESAGQGTDSVQSSITYTLAANVENLILTGSSSIDATGNNLNNVISGNSGNNIIDGGAGADQMLGGTGDDTYIVDNVSDYVGDGKNSGIDTVLSSVSYTITNSSNIENLTLTGEDEIDATGNNLNNELIGNSSNNVLDGATGVDTMVGGLGDDTYTVDDYDDVVIEDEDGGIDTVVSSIIYELGSNIENLTLIGTEETHATGNELDNVLIGSSINNTLDGREGSDTMMGGEGDDSYFVDNEGDTVTEHENEGDFDEVYSTVTFVLGANIETLYLEGNNEIDGTGNDGDNTIFGNANNNILIGGAGNDTIYGGYGTDIFQFTADTIGAVDVIADFNLSEGDKMDVSDLLFGYDPLTDLITDFIEITTSGSNSVVNVDQDGSGSTYAMVQIATLNDVSGLTDEEALVTNGNLIA